MLYGRREATVKFRSIVVLAGLAGCTLDPNVVSRLTSPTYTPAAVVVHTYDPLVSSVQGELIRLNYLGPGDQDGIPGPRTSNAISAFESANNLPVDGVASHHLLAALQATRVAVAPAAPPPSAPPAPAAANQPWVAPPQPAASSPPPAKWVTPN
jgi:peptidoglycan hydrolase-like protein with peptidoglycan-binding domain